MRKLALLAITLYPVVSCSSPSRECETAVRNALIAPSSADFVNTEVQRSGGERHFVVVGSVDAVTPRGVPLRHEFICSFDSRNSQVPEHVDLIPPNRNYTALTDQYVEELLNRYGSPVNVAPRDIVLPPSTR